MKIFRQIVGYSVVLGWIGGCTYGYAADANNWVAAGAFLFFVSLILSDWR